MNDTSDLKNSTTFLLTWESQTSCHTTHSCRHQVVQVSVSRGGEFEGSETDVVQGLVVDTKGFVGVFNQLMH